MRKSACQHKIIDVPESEFSFTLARVAAAQICQSTGFNGAQSPALEALTDIATRHLKAIAKLSADSANSNGRTQSNLADIIVALEDLASVQGFPGSSNVRSRSLCTSAVIKDLMKFVKYTDEIPFAQPLPPRRSFFQGGKGCFLKQGDNRGWNCNGGNLNLKHVPRWLPVVPVVEGKEKSEGREGEVKWGCLELDGKEERGEKNWGCAERKTVKRELNNEMERSGKRGKVRFKIGVELGNPGMIGKLRGVGIGKRVCCER